MEIREVERVTTQTDEVFYLGDLRTYWFNVYIKERPELMPYKNSKYIETRVMHQECIDIGPHLSKAYFIHKDSCKFHEYDYIPTLEKPELHGQVFYIFQFYNDLYFVEKDYVHKYKEIQGFVFLKKLTIMHDLLFFVKIAEGMYRNMKREFYVYLNSKYIYIINTDSLYQWKIYKEKFHPNEEFCLKHEFGIPWKQTKWINYYQDDLFPIYAEEEVIRISKGIYRTRNIIPEKISKKYAPIPYWHIEPIFVNKREDYFCVTPEFLSFKTLSNNEYLINIDSIEEWQKIVEQEKDIYSSGFLYKKFLYSVQPQEYQLIKKGIYLRTKSVDPYKDSPPK